MLRYQNPRGWRQNVGEGFDVILPTPEVVLVSQHRPDAEGLISILKCLKLTIDIIFKIHFIAHLSRSNATYHANPDSGGRRRRADQSRLDNAFHGRSIKWTICIGFSQPDKTYLGLNTVIRLDVAIIQRKR
jgi:hypothetical protein